MNWSNHYTLINTLISGTICSIVNSNQSIKHWKIEKKNWRKLVSFKIFKKNRSINQIMIIKMNWMKTKNKTNKIKINKKTGHHDFFYSGRETKKMKKKPQFYFGRCPNIIITVEMKCRNTFFRNSNSFSIIIIIINCPMLCVVVDINNKHLINKHTRCIFNLQHSGEIDGNVLQWVNLCWVVIVVEEFFLLNFFLLFGTAVNILSDGQWIFFQTQNCH